MTLIDAKKRSIATEMTPADVAEASSKYLWSLRVDETNVNPEESRSDYGRFAVNKSLIVSTGRMVRMHHPASRTEYMQMLPANKGDMQRHLDGVLKSYSADDGVTQPEDS
jgi:hypothetical protein